MVDSVLIRQVAMVRFISCYARSLIRLMGIINELRRD